MIEFLQYLKGAGQVLSGASSSCRERHMKCRNWSCQLTDGPHNLRLALNNKPQQGERLLLDNRRGDTFVAFEHVQKSYDGQTLVVKDLNLSIGK